MSCLYWLLIAYCALLDFSLECDFLAVHFLLSFVNLSNYKIKIITF